MRPVIATLVADGLLVSVDTRWAEVAAAAIAGGAHIVNDISGLADPDMVGVAAATGTPLLIGHMLGTPATMQDHPTYDDVVAEVTASLRDGAARALDGGVPSVLVDPGHRVREVPRAQPGVAAGTAPRRRPPGRRRGVAQGLHRPVDRRDGPVDRDAGPLAVHLVAAQRGTALVRAHDVAAHVQALTVLATLGG